MGIITTAAGRQMQEVAPIVGDQTALSVSAPTLLKSGKGRLGVVSLSSWGSSAGVLYDAASVGAASAANQIGYVLNTSAQATIEYNFPFFNGLVFVPGTGQVVSISYM